MSGFPRPSGLARILWGFVILLLIGGCKVGPNYVRPETKLEPAWQEAGDKNGRLRLIVTQALHWFAFLLVMNLMLLSSVQRIFTAQATGLAVFTLLALGTFTAGVHVLSWQVCLLGLIMALGIPAIAWIENSALLVVPIAVAIVGVGAVLWWHWHQGRSEG